MESREQAEHMVGTALADLFVEADLPTNASLHARGKSDGPLQEGQVTVQVVKLVVTANTMTYALAGKMPGLTYFQHFPVPKDAHNTIEYGRPPCWGTGVVTESQCPKVPVGTRIHGLFPMSPFVILTPAKVTTTQFIDAAPYRAGLFEPYLTYTLHDAPVYRNCSPDEEDWQMGAGNLFSTGWSLAHTAAVHVAKPTALILTSASSRTSIGAAFAAKFHKLPLQVIGLTSAANVDVVRKLGLYEIVCSYDDVASLQKQKVAVLDVAGNASVQQAVYQHFGEKLVYFGRVGMVHVESVGQKASLKFNGGDPPSQFIVFIALNDLQKAYGKNKMLEMLGEATAAYKERMFPSFQAVRTFGPNELLRVYEDLIQGKLKSECTYVCSPWPKGLDEPNFSKL